MWVSKKDYDHLVGLAEEAVKQRDDARCDLQRVMSENAGYHAKLEGKDALIIHLERTVRHLEAHECPTPAPVWHAPGSTVNPMADAADALKRKEARDKAREERTKEERDSLFERLDDVWGTGLSNEALAALHPECAARFAKEEENTEEA